MAVLGLQIVFTMIMVSCMSKFSAHMSFGRWLLCCGGLARYEHPSDDELRRIASVSTSSGRINALLKSGMDPHFLKDCS